MREDGWFKEFDRWVDRHEMALGAVGILLLAVPFGTVCLALAWRLVRG